MRGDLPPNSSETTFKLLSAAACITLRPTSVEPVKLTWKIQGHTCKLKQEVTTEFPQNIYMKTDVL